MITTSNVNFQILWNKFLAQPSLIPPDQRFILNIVKELREENARLKEQLVAIGNARPQDNQGPPGMDGASLQPAAVGREAISELPYQADRPLGSDEHAKEPAGPDPRSKEQDTRKPGRSAGGSAKG